MIAESFESVLADISIRFEMVSVEKAMILNVSESRVSLSPSKKHHILFYSPVLDRLVVPYVVQIDLFDSNGFQQEKVSSVRSASNTHTKPWNPTVNTSIRGK
jgi:hypothetical protein